MFDKKMRLKRGQIWVETVIYTLIALVMIGVVLSVVKPRIEQSQDQAIIEQSMNIIEDLDSIILDIKRVPGNQRIAGVMIKKGNLIIDGVNDKIIFKIESRYEYSEPGESIVDDATGITIRTERKGKLNNVTLTKDYSDKYNITYGGDDKVKTITRASTPYKFFLSNKGEDKIILELEVLCPNGVEECDSLPNKPLYEKQCTGGLCRYVSERTTINIDAT